MSKGSWRGGSKRRDRRPIGRKASRISGLPSRYDRKLRLESLEDRRVLATFTVLNLQDLDVNGAVVPGSLRQAINLANANDGLDTIVFSETAAASAGGTIFLSNHANGGALNITDDLIIAGPGARKITIQQGRNDARIFNIDDGDEDNFISVTITGLGIQGANLVGTDETEDRGAGIRNLEILTLNEVRVANNNASAGGGGLLNLGIATINRSLFIGNNAGFLEDGSGGGGGVLNGLPEDDENAPRTTISNSTFTQNSEAIRNSDGTVNIEHSTIVGNTFGVTSLGNPVADAPEEGEEPGPPPAPVIFTNVTHSIFANNGVTGMGVPIDGRYDISTIGVADGDDDSPPRSLEPSVFSLGWNIYGIDPEARDPRQFLMPTPDPKPPVVVEMTDLVGDPGLLPLDDYGGSVNTFLPDRDAASIAIDAGNPDFFPLGFGGAYENRGRHFTRVFGGAIDIGATEVQDGQFVVDTLIDDNDGQYSGFGSTDYLDSLGIITSGSGFIQRGDFSLREALDFARKNPGGANTITFAPNLLIQPDTTFSKPPTILLTLGELIIDVSVVIQGPTTFELEIDASGNDPTPNLNAADGSRVFRIDDGDINNLIDVTISNLTIMGGDVVDRGGGILSRENLTLTNSWIKDNYASNDGGGLFVQFGNVYVDSSTFSENTAADDGGAIFLDIPVFGATDPLEAVIVNSTISANTVGDRGAGIGNQNYKLTVSHSTITLNSAASTRASGIATFGGPLASTTIRSTIVSGNVNNDIEFVSPATIAKYVSEGYNIIGNGNAAPAFNQPGDQTGVLNPMLGALIKDGGPTPTHKPLLGSPAIDAGNPLDVPGGGAVPLFDQRGSLYTRVFDGNQDGTARIDVGAYELQGLTFVVDTTVDENDGNYSVGNLSLREAIELSNINPLPDVIMFDPTVMFDTVIQQSSKSFLTPGTSADMRITDSVTIVGLGLDFLTIDLSSAYDDTNFTNPIKARLFTVDDGNSGKTIDVKIQDLKIQNGKPFGTNSLGEPVQSMGPGGVIYSTENLVVEGVFFVNNGVVGAGIHGGVIYQQGGTLTLGASPGTGNPTTLTANNTDGIGSHGGGVAALNATVIIKDDTSLSGNSTLKTASHGGGIYVQGGMLRVEESSITGNITASGAARGGGVYANSGNVLFKGANLSGNATAGANSDGAGLYSNLSTVVFEESNVSLNQTIGTASRGAGVFANGGSVSFVGSRIAQNKTFGAGSVGAGILATNSASVSLFESNLTGNETFSTSAHGAGLYNVGANVVLRNSLVAANRANAADANGGGIWSDTNLSGTETTVVLNSTISGNVAGGRGGGVYNADGVTQILHSTVTNNSATTGFFGYGGGVASFGSSAVQTHVGSSIIAGNAGSDVDQVLGSFVNSFLSTGYNVVGNGLATGHFIASGDKRNVVNALLGPLVDNGGTTFTHALLDGSPAINAGNPLFSAASFLPPLTADQRGFGFDRVLKGRIDVGAFESDFASAANADFGGNGIVDGSDFLTWQRGKGIASGASPAQGDANNDGAVDAADLAVWRDQFGTNPSAETLLIAAAEAGGLVTASPVEAAPLIVEVAPAPILTSGQWLAAPSIDLVQEEDSASADAVYAEYGGEVDGDLAPISPPAEDDSDLMSDGHAEDDSELAEDFAFAALDSGESWLAF
ncbi:MAG: hypothetical protein KF847_14820 [Pirellulales bacterium]|nr:hypothetical protein [Pirellulales bacterium]